MFYELDTYSRDLDTRFSLGDCLFGAVKLTDNAVSNKYGCSGFGIEFDAYSRFLSQCRKKILSTLQFSTRVCSNQF